MDPNEQFNNLRQAILNKIVSDETEIQEAYFEEVTEFNGSPAAVVGVSANQATYSSTATDRMTFAFTIRLYVPLPDRQSSEVTERIMGRAYWNLLRMFRRRDVLSGVCDMVEPVPSVWEFEERGPGIYRTSTITLRCVIFLSNQ